MPLELCCAAPCTVTSMQFILAVTQEGLITEAEAEAWVQRNALPALVLAVIDTLPEADRAKARIKALGMTEAERASPLILAAAAHLGLTEEQTDNIFRLAATL